jgi:CRISPR/Cas system-associated exonuclease Cas4 (RecB family)
MIKKVSATKLDTFTSCPYRYYIKYIQNLSDQEKKTPAMQYGLMIHEILKDFNAWIRQNSLPGDPKEIQRITYNKIMDIIYSKFNKYSDTINKFITPFNVYKDHIALYLDNFFFPQSIYTKNFEEEKEFNITIEDISNTISKSKLSPLVEKYKHVILTGKIDLIVFPDIIVDFKTQAKKSFRKMFISNFQTIFYTLIYPRDITFIYMFLWKKYETATLHLSSETRADKLNHVVSIIDNIENSGNFNKHKNACKTCVFKHICKI